MLTWLDSHLDALTSNRPDPSQPGLPSQPEPGDSTGPDFVFRSTDPGALLKSGSAKVSTETEGKFGRRAEDSLGSPKSLKVDQTKIDRLMNLIGELGVSKNALPYLAERAETQYGVRELSREIKGQYAVFNRIADEMQDAIMQVRMMAVSFIFQRFPRLVRDISRKLGKEVQLVLEGEQTEADKNIIESLADPLIHIEPLAKSLASDVPLGCAVILIRHSSILKARHRFFVDEGTPRAPLARFLDTPRPCLAPICLRWKA
jgi:two-component system chemotaxis sensor kinase CheA